MQISVTLLLLMITHNYKHSRWNNEFWQLLLTCDEFYDCKNDEKSLDKQWDFMFSTFRERMAVTYADS